MLGFVGGYFGSLGGLYSNTPTNETKTKQQVVQNNPLNPFQTFHEKNIDNAEYQFEALQLKIEGLQIQIEALQKQQEKTAQKEGSLASKSNSTTRRFSRTAPNKENLISAGMNSDIADDVLRRISQQQFRRLELQNLMQRSNSTQRRQYSKELRELNKNKISLRSEMGDDSYDQYLFISGQNNRVKVSSVMAGSPAETSGFQSEDIILSYDNQKILSWPDIRAATIEGEIGSYTSVEILRNGEQMSLTVPRGTLGVQLDAVQVEP